MRSGYYMLAEYEDGFSVFINPYDDIKRARSAVKWQKQGFPNTKYIICRRISKDTFIEVETKREVKINIENRQPYTQQAWDRFLNQVN